MSDKVGAMMGGNSGVAFDDGVFLGVKKIIVGKDLGCVSYIKIEYEKDGKFETREHGTIRGELNEFSVDYPNEYITSVGGSYGHVQYYEDVLINSLIFKTNKGKTSPVLGGGITTSGKPVGTEFMLEGKNGGKLLGFFGRSGQALDAIGAYFDTGSQGGVGPLGGNSGVAFDDGIFLGVKKIIVGKDLGCVSYIKIEYEKDGKYETREHGTIRGELKEFSVDYPNEYITSVGGSYGHVKFYEDVLITTLIFKTNKGRTSTVLGGGTTASGTEFMLEDKNGGKLLGFFGRSGQALDAIGVYFDTGSQGGVGPLGGNSGVAFDDGVFLGVKKIIVGKDLGCVSYIKIEYEKDGKIETREHGTIRGELKEFSVDYPNEYITSVGGSYGHVKYYEDVLVTTLIFKTNKGRTSTVLGGGTTASGTEFMLEGKNRGKLLGFFGRSGQALDAIGAYFDTRSYEGVGPFGGNSGVAFDDGVFLGVKKIIVGKDLGCVSYIKIEYEKDGKFETREHGTIRGELKEFSVDYPNEYITSVGGNYGHVKYYEDVLITTLIFKTNKGRTSTVLGGGTTASGTEFMLEGKNRGKLLGFFGCSGQALDAIGAYFEIV